MNAQALAQLTQQHWDDLGYNDDSEPKEFDLENHDLLDLFSFFDDQKGPALEYREDEYTFDQLSTLLRPGFLLASAFLNSPAAIRFQYALLYGNYRAIPDLTQQFQTPVRQLDLPIHTVPYEEMQNKVKEVLQRLARCTKLGLAKESDISDLKAARAVTRAAWKKEGDVRTLILADVLGDSSRRGVASSVRINDKYVTVLRDLHRHRNTNAFAILTANLMFGKTLFHEIMHVIYNAISNESRQRMLWVEEKKRNPATAQPEVHLPIEPLFQSQQVSELGFAADTYVFGGYLEWEWTAPASYPTICDWPSFLRLEERDYLRGPGPPQMTADYIVPGFYIRRIQQPSFWASLKRGDITALHVARIVGVQFLRGPNNIHQPIGPQQHSGTDPSSVYVNRPYHRGAQLRYDTANRLSPGS